MDQVGPVTGRRNGWYPILLWALLSGGSVVVWFLQPNFAGVSSVAIGPGYLLIGFALSVYYGYRGRPLIEAIVAGAIGGSAGALLFIGGFRGASSQTEIVLRNLGTGAAAGFLIGGMAGSFGYAVGRLLRRR